MNENRISLIGVIANLANGDSIFSFIHYKYMATLSI